MADADIETDATDSQSPGQAGTGAERGERSATRYPYYDLEEAVRFAKAIRETGGDDMLEDALLSHMQLSRTTKSWIYKLSTAREFGLVERKGQKNEARIALTDLAKRLLKPHDPAMGETMKVAAFLTPPLYKKLFDKYRGAAKPQTKYLANFLCTEHKILESVSEQAAGAFLASAQFAGMIVGDSFIANEKNVGMGKDDGAPSNPPDGKPTIGAIPQGMVRHAYFIRNGSEEIAIVVPRDLKSKDVKRISKWLETLAVDDDDDEGGA